MFSIFTRILIFVQVLASSQREPISRKNPRSASGCSQLLAQRQALRGYILVTVIYQYSSSTLLSSERAANCHICDDDNKHMHCLDINRFKAPLRQFRLKKNYLCIYFNHPFAQICGHLGPYFEGKCNLSRNKFTAEFKCLSNTTFLSWDINNHAKYCFLSKS